MLRSQETVLLHRLNENKMIGHNLLRKIVEKLMERQVVLGFSWHPVEVNLN